jgi:ribonuclease HII
MMIELDKKYPEYGYAKHKGYPTKDHIEAVKKYGVKDFYRMTFAPINELVNKNNK